MKKIYLDYQFIIDEVDGRKNWELSNIDYDKYQIVYSSAHIEEIVNGDKYKKLKEDIFIYIKYLSDITKNRQLIRTDSPSAEILDKSFGEKGIYLVKEDPIYCYKRVVKHLDKNEISEQGQKQILSRVNRELKTLNPKNRQRKVEKVQKMDISDIFKNNEIFNKFLDNVCDTYLCSNIISKYRDEFNLDNDSYIKMLYDEYKNITFKEKKNIKDMFESIFHNETNIFKKISFDHSLVENIIDNLMKILMSCGFYLEAEKKATSNLHDTTHCIYAAYSDFFITRDRKFKYKVEAIYNYLNIKTQVIFVDDMDNEDNWVNKFIK